MNKKSLDSVLITGGAGYIGSELVGWFLDRDYHVTVLDNLMYDKTSLLRYANDHRFNFVKGDVRNHSLLSQLVSKADIIIPLAALVGAPLCDKNQQAAIDIHSIANQYIASIKSKDQIVIYPNSNSGYGSTDGLSALTEKDPLNPISIYGKTKCEGEIAYQQSENCVTFRLATVFGPSSRMRTDLLVNNLVLKAMKEKVLIVYEGHFMRNYIHITDIVRAFGHVVNNWEKCKNETYNVGNDKINMSKLQLCNKIAEHLPLEIIEAQIATDNDKRNYIVSSRKFYNKGFECMNDLDDGIRQLIKTYNMLWDDFTVYANY